MDDSLVILVIEDDEAIQSIVEEALAEGGFEPAIAASGEEAVTVLKGKKRHPRLSRTYFECSTCERTEKVSVAIDPMKTDAIGWLASELRPPHALRPGAAGSSEGISSCIIARAEGVSCQPC